MKKFYPSFCAAVLLFMVACSNETATEPAASTPQTTAPASTTPASTPPATPPANTKTEVVVKRADTARTTISVGTSGGSVKTKKGTEVSVDDKGVNIGTKDVKIDIKH